MSRLCVSGCVVLLLALAVGGNRLLSPTPTAAALQADRDLRWFRGNMHTHSYWSDGDDYLENIALWYRERDYDFLVFTDHNTLARSEKWVDVGKVKSGAAAYEKLKRQWGEHVVERQVEGRTEVKLKTFDEVSELVGLPGKYLLIQGEEITDKFGKLPIHLNAHNLQDLIPPLGGNSVREVMQNNVNAVIAQRERTRQPMFVHLNHPNFGFGVTAEDLMRVRGENFFEVYNGHPGVNNSGYGQHVSTERMWDVMLTRRIAELDLPLMYGLATDDGHNYHQMPSRASEPGRGWVMVLASELSPASLIAAIEAGRFYSSSGVTLEQVTSTPESLEVVIREEPGVTYVTEFIGTRQGYPTEHEPFIDKNGKPLRATHRYSNELGQVLETVMGPSAQYRCQGDELYVRARVTSSRLHPNPSQLGEFERAWVQPMRGPGAPPVN